MPVTKILIADDNDIFIEGLSLLISTNNQFEIIGTCKNGRELINSPLLISADLLLVDIEMPELGGIHAATIINRQFHELPMIAISMFSERVYIQEVLGAGFRGFIHKPDVSKMLFDVIDRVMNNEFAFPNNLRL